MTLWITESIPPADGQRQSPAAVPSLTAIAMEQLENKSLDNIVLDCRKSCPWSLEHILAAADLLREAGLVLSMAELVYLIDRKVPLNPKYLGSDNTQNLVERIYTRDTIFDNILENQMERAAMREKTVNAVLALLRKKRIVLL